MLLNDRDQIIAMTAEWTGERYPNGRPRVSDEKIEILKNLTQEEIWQPLYSCGYRFQFQGDLKPLHPDKKLYGRAVTCCFMPQRPDLRQHVFNVARSRGWKGDCNQWVIDSLEESDVVVCDLYDKILRGTFVGGNLTTAVKARTKNGGVVVWGGVRDLEQMQNIDVQVFYRGVDPTPIRDCQITAFNGPCRIGAAICLPGDIVIGTKNGILFVPSHMVDYVIEHAYKSQVRDLYAFPKLEAGMGHDVLGAAGPLDDKGNVGGDVVGLAVFAIAAHLAQILAVVRADNDGHIVINSLLAQLVKQQAQLLVRVPDAGIVFIDHMAEIIGVLDLHRLARGSGVGLVVISGHFAGRMSARLGGAVLIQNLLGHPGVRQRGILERLAILGRGTVRDVRVPHMHIQHSTLTFEQKEV